MKFKSRMKTYRLCICGFCASWIKEHSDVHSVCVKIQALLGVNRELVYKRISEQDEKCT